VPLFRDGCLFGVFDLDSPIPARFDADDQRGLEGVAQVYLDSLAPLPGSGHPLRSIWTRSDAP